MPRHAIHPSAELGIVGVGGSQQSDNKTKMVKIGLKPIDIYVVRCFHVIGFMEKELIYTKNHFLLECIKHVNQHFVLNILC